MESSSKDGLFRSGMAARLAGIPVATLRVWERRYQLAGAQSGTAGHRRYTRDDVARLALLKRLVDAGHPIGSIARLPIESLRQMQSTALPAENLPTHDRPMRVAFAGEALSATAEDARKAAAGLEVVAACGDIAQASHAFRGKHADLLVVSLPTLGDEAAPLIDSLCALLEARGAVVVYRFGTDARIETLRGRGHVVVRAPLGLERLEAIAASLPAGERSPKWPPAQLHPVRFDERTLARLAHATTAIACECPRHLVELVLDLGAFERYSAECAHRSPRDARLHRELQRVSSTARAMMEDALARVAEEDGLSIDGIRGAP
jgi:MerR family transcriptional regulator, light-induced transcriptional regulator